MIIATTNDIYEVTPTLDEGLLNGGSLEGLAFGNFSLSAQLGDNGSGITISFGPVTASYVGIHGIRSLDATSDRNIGIRDNGASIGVSDAVINSRNLNTVFSFTERTFTNLQIVIDGTLDIIISYVAAGLSTQVPFGGVKPGQILPYFQYNYKTKAQTNQDGLPTTQRYRKTSSRVSVNLNNMPIDWIRNDLQDMYQLYNRTQIVSMLDFESENLPTESWAAYNMAQPKTTAYNGTRALVGVNLQFSGSA